MHKWYLHVLLHSYSVTFYGNQTELLIPRSLILPPGQSHHHNFPELFIKDEEEETNEPPTKRPASGSVSPLTTASNSPISNGTPSSPEPRDDHMIHEPAFTQFQSPWFSYFRDQDDFEYTLKLLKRSLGEASSRRSSPPLPIDLLVRVFPAHKRDVLDLILKGCNGNLVQAIEAILDSDCISQTKTTPKTNVAVPKPSAPTMHLNTSFPGIPTEAAYPGRPLASSGLLRMIPPMCFGPVSGNVAPRAPLPNMAIFTQRGVPVTSAGFHFQLNRGSEENHTVPFSGGSEEEIQFTPSPNRSPPREGHCFRCGATPQPESRFCCKCGAELIRR